VVKTGQDQLSLRAHRAHGGERSRQAEERLADSSYRLQRAKLEALIGIRYDADEYDRLVLDYRDAKRRADALRRARHLLHIIAVQEARDAVLPPACVGGRPLVLGAAA
jgi:hypothetical protein